MNSIIVKAPAKVNLFLKILSKRSDSYHNILTLFERISIVDTIKICKAAKGIIVKSDISITRDPKDNIVYKSARMMLDRADLKCGVKIEIRKKIPIAAGFGGGSSDGAAVLMGMNKLFGMKLSRANLMSMGRRLGADVPFFLLNTPFAIGRGRGDILKIMRSKKSLWHLIIMYGSKVSTKAIYEAFDASRGSVSRRLTGSAGDVKIPFPSRLCIDYNSIESILHNDLEPAFVSKERITGSILESLAHLLGKKAIVSGSGPGLFCLYRARKEAMKEKRIVLEGLPKQLRHGMKLFVVETYR